jgi:hypothetical protein
MSLIACLLILLLPLLLLMLFVLSVPANFKYDKSNRQTCLPIFHLRQEIS